MRIEGDSDEVDRKNREADAPAGLHRRGDEVDGASSSFTTGWLIRISGATVRSNSRD
jgi:hypothetical protein